MPASELMTRGPDFSPGGPPGASPFHPSPCRQLTGGADRGDLSIRWTPRGAHKGGPDGEREACGQFHDRGHWAPGGREEAGRAPWLHSPVAGLWPSPGSDGDSPGPGFSPAPGPAAPWPCHCPCSADPPSYPRAAECKSLATNLGSALGMPWLSHGPARCLFPAPWETPSSHPFLHHCFHPGPEPEKGYVTAGTTGTGARSVSTPGPGTGTIQGT